MDQSKANPRPESDEDERDGRDPYGETHEAQRETVRGEQGTSSGDPHDDTDPQSG
ncbi:MAG TPA: hypothetical protein VJX66_06780 [Amycolatopsis sp.]|nr:hypothetical protein [Amycolatopsis sp.]